MRRAAMVMDVTGMRVEERGMAATAAAAEPELAAAPPTAAGRRAASPLAVALGALDRPIGVERPLGREKWQQVDPDVLAELGDRITSLSARLSAENRRLLALIHEFDRLEGWKAQGHASCAAWLAHRTKSDKATARERVRVARALAERPLTDAAMARGELSYSQVRAITRAPAEDEVELLEHTHGMTASELEKLVRSWRRLGREDEGALAERIHRSRTLSVFPDDEGAYVIRGKFEPEVGALIMRAIEAASDALYRGSVPGSTPEQRRADALALLVERAMAVGFGGDEGADREASGAEEAEAEAGGVSAEAPGRLDAVTCDVSAEAPRHPDPAAAAEPPKGDVSAEAPPAPSGAKARARSWGVAHPERYTVVLHVRAETLEHAPLVGQEGGAGAPEEGAEGAETPAPGT